MSDKEHTQSGFKGEKEIVNKLKLYLDTNMVGQETLKRAIITKIYRYINNEDVSPLLMIGPSGSGKTYIVELLQMCNIEEINRLNIMKFDASRLTPNGFSGDSCEVIIKAWKQSCAKNKKKEDRGIIYIDEFDKILVPNYDSGGANVNALVQYQFMNYLQGTDVYGINTGKILFILGGAFEGLENIEEEKRRNCAIGFNVQMDNTDFVIEDNLLRENIIRFGARKELIGRISSIVRISKLDKVQLKAVLLHPQIGAIARKKLQLKKDGIDFELTKDVVDWMVDKVVEEDLGARSVYNILNAVVGKYEFTMLSSGYSFMEINMKCILGDEPIFKKNANVESDRQRIGINNMIDSQIMSEGRVTIKCFMTSSSKRYYVHENQNRMLEIINENYQKVDLTIILSFGSDDTHKEYLVFTDYERDSLADKYIYVATYNVYHAKTLADLNFTLDEHDFTEIRNNMSDIENRLEVIQYT